MPRKPQPPRATLHKPSGRARIRIDGKYRYIGPWDSDEHHREEKRLQTEWRRSRMGVVDHRVYDIVERFVVDHGLCAGATLTRHQGKQRTTAQHVLAYEPLAARPLAGLRPADFEGFLDYLANLETVKRDEHGDVLSRRPRYTRKSCNEMGGMFRYMVRYAERKGAAPVGTWNQVGAAEQLRRGRSPARESQPVEPVADEVVRATLAHLPPVVADMVRFQRLVGCRPGEVSRLKLADTVIEEVPVEGRSITVRLWNLKEHKTAHMGKRRTIVIGPQALLIIQRRAAGDEDPVFRTPPGGAYSRDAYRRAIARACEKADIERWSPNQLRHARATELNKLVGLETAGAVLGHERIETTQIYAQKNMQAAMRAAAMTG